MQGTVDIRDDQHQALLALMEKRGLKDFSPLVQAAVDAYLAKCANEASATYARIRALAGSVSDEEAEHMREVVSQRHRAADAMSAFESFTDEDGESLARHVQEIRSRWR
jgi:hypothetical protein